MSAVADRAPKGDWPNEMPRRDRGEAETPMADPLNQPVATRKPLNSNQKVGHTRCGAAKKNGIPCGLPAGYRTEHPGFGHCYFHYGETDAGRKSAAIERAAGLVIFYGKPIDTNPIEALLDEVSRTAGHVAFLGGKIARWPAENQLDENDAITPALSGWIQLYQSERKHLVAVSKAALDAGVNERLVQIAEHQGARLADSVESILRSLNLSPEQWRLVPEVVPQILRGLIPSLPAIEGEVVADESTAN